MSKGGGQGSFAQMQEPGLGMDMGGFGGGPQPAPAFERPQMDNRMGMPSFNPEPIMRTQGPDSISGGLGSKGGRFNPYQTDSIVPPGQTAGLPNQFQPPQGESRRGYIEPGRPDLNMGLPTPPIALPIVAPGVDPKLDSQPIADAVQPPVGGTMYDAGGNPNFDERTGQFETGGIKPLREPVKLEPIKAMPDINLPTSQEVQDGMGGRGGINPGGMYSNPRPPFMPGPRPPFMPGPRPPVFGPPRNFPLPMPRPRPPRIPGRNTQFQMPFFGSQYGRMNPYAGQFSGYGVPSNMFSFAQPHYQPYVPPPPQPSAPPVMQLPPGQGSDAFTAGFGGQGIGGFGRYNLGLARRQFGGR